MLTNKKTRIFVIFVCCVLFKQIMSRHYYFSYVNSFYVWSKHKMYVFIVKDARKKKNNTKKKEKKYKKKTGWPTELCFLKPLLYML